MAIISAYRERNRFFYDFIIFLINLKIKVKQDESLYSLFPLDLGLLSYIFALIFVFSKILRNQMNLWNFSQFHLITVMKAFIIFS